MTLIEVVKGLDCQRTGHVTSEKEDQSFCSQGKRSAVMEYCIRMKNNLHDIGGGV